MSRIEVDGRISLKGLEVGTVISGLQFEDTRTDATVFAEKYFPGEGLIPYSVNPKFDQHWKEDLLVAAQVGDRFRLPIEWGNLFPENEATLDRKALQEYKDRIEYAKSMGLKVDLCLKHFTLPLWANKKGGLLGGEIPWLFEDYVETVLNELGGSLDPDTRINIINEPPTELTMRLANKNYYRDDEVSFGRRLVDMFGMNDQLGFMTRRGKHKIKSHNRKTRHGEGRTRFRGYSAVQYTPIHAANPESRSDRMAASLADKLQNKLPLDTNVAVDDEFVTITYYREVTVGFLPKFRADYKTVNEREDNCGRENDYDVGLFRVNGSNLGDQELRSINGWPFVPEALMETLETVHKMYPDKKIILGENGFAGVHQESGARDLHLDDLTRCVHLIAHMVVVAKAIEKGIPIVEFDFWSLLDNNEFGLLRTKFGILGVDFDDPELKRFIRPTFYVLRDIKENKEVDLDRIYSLLRENCNFNDGDVEWIDRKVRSLVNG